LRHSHATDRQHQAWQQKVKSTMTGGGHVLGGGMENLPDKQAFGQRENDILRQSPALRRACQRK
jgi:hypothetical protein